MIEIKITRSWKDPRGVTHGGLIQETVNEFEVIDCAICGFKHVIPIPSEVELQNIYSHDYYAVEKPLYIERYLEDKDWWDCVYSGRYDILEEHLDSHQRKILDVGSGPGLFLLKGQERGWHVKGIEPSAQAASYSRDTLGLEVEEAFFNEETAKHLGKFDAINMSEVLEHIPNPTALLNLVHAQLNTGGLVCLIVPNDFNPFQLALRDHFGYSPWWVAPPHHINYFDFKSLAGLVGKCGFEVLHQESTFPIDMFLLMGDNYIGDDEVGRASHTKRMNFEKAMIGAGGGDILARMYTAFADQNLGREVVIFARANKILMNEDK